MYNVIYVIGVTMMVRKLMLDTGMIKWTFSISHHDYYNSYVYNNIIIYIPQFQWDQGQ